MAKLATIVAPFSFKIDSNADQPTSALSQLKIRVIAQHPMCSYKKETGAVL
jgi:hypothetical protein